jgi:hypothetical protein
MAMKIYERFQYNASERKGNAPMRHQAEKKVAN